MATTVTTQSLVKINAIAGTLLARYLPDDNEIDRPAWAGYEAVVYSDAAKFMRSHDARFPSSEPFTGDENDPEDADSVMNRITSYEGFRLGFGLAMELASRIALDPLGDHDVAAILEPYEAQYIAYVKRQRDKVWAKRQAAEMMPA